MSGIFLVLAVGCGSGTGGTGTGGASGDDAKAVAACKQACSVAPADCQAKCNAACDDGNCASAHGAPAFDGVEQVVCGSAAVNFIKGDTTYACQSSGGTGGSPTTGPFDAKCELACRNTACDAQATQCKADCIVVTEGLTATCGQCVVDSTETTADPCDTYIPRPTGAVCNDICTGDFSSQVDFAKKCKLACRNDACPSEASQCESDCTTTTTGLSAECGQCVVDYTETTSDPCDAFIPTPTGPLCSMYCGG